MNVTGAARRALLVVDVQNGFTEGSGELPVEGGDDVARRIGAFTAEHRGKYDVVATTQDWHVDPGGHFSDNPDFVETWPVHCVAGTDGAELDPQLDEGAGRPFTDLVDVAVRKGAHAAAYSGFEGVTAEGESLEQALRHLGVTDLDVVGIAESHCVRHTVLDARQAGFAVRVLSDLTVPVTPELGEAARANMSAAGATSVTSAEAFPHQA